MLMLRLSLQSLLESGVSEMSRKRVNGNANNVYLMTSRCVFRSYWHCIAAYCMISYEHAFEMQWPSSLQPP